MEIIAKNSILKRLPNELEKDKFLIFDALRFSFEIIQHNYNELVKRLLINSEENKKEISSSFNYAWSIIDNSSRLVRICKQLPWENSDEIIGKFNYLNDFRNTYQHLDERIYESLLKNLSPFFGIIIYFYKDLETNNFTPTILYSGVVKGPKVEFKIPELKDSTKKINNIILQTVNKQKVIRIDLSLIMDDLKKLCCDLENRMTNYCNINNLSSLNWESRQDIIVRIKQEKK